MPTPTPPQPACAACRFGRRDSQSKAQAQPTYAGAVLGGAENSGGLLQSADALANTETVPGLVAFCTRCKRTSWLARHDSVSDSLIDFHRRLRELRELEAAVA